MKKLFPIGLLLFTFWSIQSCTKDDNTGGSDGNYKLTYGDSIFYINPSVDYTITPVGAPMGGSYTGFPEGIDIDNLTGAIRVNKSETGLRYRITYTAVNGDTSNAIILIGGINYYDQIYDLSKDDTTAKPLYNASLNRNVPANSIFDEGNGCKLEGVEVDASNGRINLAACVRNGVFGTTPTNGVRKEVELRYRINDGSNKNLNSLKVKLYYYNTSADIDADLIQLLKDREGTVFGTGPTPPPVFQMTTEVLGLSNVRGVAKPRPPCIFLVGRM